MNIIITYKILSKKIKTIDDLYNLLIIIIIVYHHLLLYIYIIFLIYYISYIYIYLLVVLYTKYDVSPNFLAPKRCFIINNILIPKHKKPT